MTALSRKTKVLVFGTLLAASSMKASSDARARPSAMAAKPVP
jgi:hypothetical protein